MFFSVHHTDRKAAGPGAKAGGRVEQAGTAFERREFDTKSTDRFQEQRTREAARVDQRA